MIIIIAYQWYKINSQLVIMNKIADEYLLHHNGVLITGQETRKSLDSPLGCSGCIQLTYIHKKY